MSRSQQRRVRPMYTPVRGKVTSDISHVDHARMRRALLLNPRLVLGLFADANIGCLAELTFWPELCQQMPRASARIREQARGMGIREYPEERPCGKPFVLP